MNLGYILPMTKALTLDRSYVIRLVEMLEDQNVALGNLMAGIAIGLAIIIAAAIH